jgi:drug/metabolite transporter, DME family
MKRKFEIRNPQIRNSTRGVLFVLLAAGLWGTLGTLYSWGTNGFGMSPVMVVFWRAGFAALMLGAVMGVVLPVSGRRGLLRVRRGDLHLFVGFGLLGVTAFYLLYIYAVVLTGVAVAVVLLYTAPVFVALMAWRFLGERLGGRKLAALALTVVGCALVSRAYDPTLLSGNVLGILCGLGSGFTYALYSIYGKMSLHRGYSIATMSFYVYGIGALGLLAVALFLGPGQLFALNDPSGWWLLLTIALFQTLGALAAYTSGLRYLEAGVASILATFEPVVATALAFFVLHEAVAWPQMLGGTLILAAVLLLQGRVAKAEP